MASREQFEKLWKSQNLQRWEVFVVSLVLLGLLCIYFWPVVFGRQTLLPTDMLFDFSFFREAAPTNFLRPSNPVLSDVVLQFYPWSVFTREELAQGHFPFWNPYVLAGTPHFANGQSAILYPINVLGYFFPLGTAIALSAIVRMFIAGLGTFLFLRRLGINYFGGLVAAVTFMFSGSMVVWLNYPIGSVYAWLPMLFFLGESLIASRKLLYAVFLGVIVAVQLLAGHFQASFIILLAFGLYCTYRIIYIYRETHNSRRVVRTAVLLAGSILLGFMLAAVQIIPFLDWLQQTDEAQIRLAERAFTLAKPAFVIEALIALSTLGLPNLFGNPHWGSSSSFLYGNYIEQMVYIGIIPLALAVLALVTGLKGVGASSVKEPAQDALPKRNLVIFTGGLGLFFLCLAIGLPGFEAINHLPLFNVVTSGRYRLVFTFCAALLAGFGAEQLLYLPSGTQILRYLSRGLLSYASIAILLLIAAGWIIITFKDALMSFGRFNTLYPILTNAFNISNLEMYSSVVIAISFVAVLYLRRANLMRNLLSRSIIVGLVYMDLFIFGSNFNPSIPESAVYPKTEAVHFLETQLAGQESFRVVALHNDLPANAGMPYHFYDLGGSEFPQGRYTELIQALGGDFFGHYRVLFSTLQPRLINLLGVKYIITSAGSDGLDMRYLQEVYQDDYSITIHENMEVLPRAFTVHQVRTITDDTQILQTLTSASFDPRNEIIIEEQPPVEFSPTQSSRDDILRINTYQAQSISIDVEMAENGFLFLSDIDYPGWRVMVDGEETSIIRANYAFRSVYLPKGEHSVEFVYSPPNFNLGLGITLAGVVIVFLVIGISSKIRYL